MQSGKFQAADIYDLTTTHAEFVKEARAIGKQC